MGELSLLESHLNIWIWLSLGLTTLSVGVALICIRTRRSVSRSALLGKIAVMPFSQVQQEMRDELERARRYSIRWTHPPRPHWTRRAKAFGCVRPALPKDTGTDPCVIGTSPEVDRVGPAHSRNSLGP